MQQKCNRTECNVIHTCLCTTVKASDGSIVCKSCLGLYESGLATLKNSSPPQNNNQNSTPVITSVSAMYSNFHK